MVLAVQRSTDLCFTVQLAPAASLPWSYFTPSCGQEFQGWVSYFFSELYKSNHMQTTHSTNISNAFTSRLKCFKCSEQTHLFISFLICQATLLAESKAEESKMYWFLSPWLFNRLKCELLASAEMLVTF